MVVGHFPAGLSARLLASIGAIAVALCVPLATSGASAAGATVSTPRGTVARSSLPYHVAYPSETIPSKGTSSPDASCHENCGSGGIPVYLITPTNYGYLSGIHACRVLGGDGNSYGVECADLYATAPESGVVDVFAAADGYCQLVANGSSTECANVSILFSEHNGAGDNYVATDGVCGHSYGPCSGGRNSFIGYGYSVVDSCDISPGSYNEWWTVDQTGSSVQLPVSDRTTASTSNLASQHAIICP
jgi:hypothetical protein